MDVSQNTDNTSNCSFTWNDDVLKQMVLLLLDYRKNTNPTSNFKWDELALAFSKKIGRTVTVVVMKNRYQGLKREYSAWKMLRNHETGLGWDPVNRRIMADKQWWDKKIKEKKECAKFRHKGMDPDWEELMDRLFGKTVAMGRLAMSPSMNPTRVPGRATVEVDGDSVGTEGAALNDFNVDEEGETLFQNFTSLLSDGCVQTPPDNLGTQTQPQRSAYVDEGTPEGDTPNASPVTGTPPMGAPLAPTGRPESSKRRRSGGAAMLNSHLSQSNSRGERMIAMLEQEASSIAKAVGKLPPSMDEGLELLGKMADEGVIDSTSALWMDSLLRNMDEKWRHTLLWLRSNEERLAFLQHSYERGKSTST